MQGSSPQVLIVGGGPCGLAAAIELGHRGIRTLVVERNDRVGYSPRSKTTHTRTCEHLRRWGIAKNLKKASPLGVDYPSNMAFVTRLNGKLITTVEDAMYCKPVRNELYAEHAQWIPQYILEEVLRVHAATLPAVTIRFQTEMISFEQRPDGVTARLRSSASGEEMEAHCEYLIGADGARSAVRDAIGAVMQGESGLSRNYNIIFHCPGLYDAVRLGPAVMYWIVNDDLPCTMGPLDYNDHWYFMPLFVPDGWKLQDFEVPALVSRATGFDLPCRILSSDEWIANRLLADRYRDRRVFLAGDAGHLHPPHGGFGMNSSVHDAVDLGWKIAATLQGWAGPTLLESYEQERKPVHRLMVEQSITNHGLAPHRYIRPGLADDTPDGERTRREMAVRIHAEKAPEFRSLGIVLGYRYDGSPTIVSDGSDPPRQTVTDYTPSAYPGCRAPHAWLEDGSSLYDHFGSGFTLLADVADFEVDAALREAGSLGVPLKAMEFPTPAIADLYQARYVLIRPDQHVAWRGPSLASFRTLLARVTGLVSPQ
jgi:2-polyprenyl-6-methoxyphenol hydroxylase-like FAD-dependent oxidoreductase